jgi:hypothetical protein
LEIKEEEPYFAEPEGQGGPFTISAVFFAGKVFEMFTDF